MPRMVDPSVRDSFIKRVFLSFFVLSMKRSAFLCMYFSRPLVHLRGRVLVIFHGYENNPIFFFCRVIRLIPNARSAVVKQSNIQWLGFCDASRTLRSWSLESLRPRGF